MKRFYTKDQLVKALKLHKGNPDVEVVLHNSPRSSTVYDVRDVKHYPNRIEIIVRDWYSNLNKEEKQI